ncbi:acid phosphatase type 7-like [Oppia nitens]|uniref:acid phosphatase type 7-like n=1 Tax=Oppia nitens TaxID=1686743 RepID=UPI0023DCE807|nr:acid phosphatase type 7-like [Oppia nitens]
MDPIYYEVIKRPNIKYKLYFVIISLLTVIFVTCFTLFYLFTLNKNDTIIDYRPQQIHLAIGDNIRELVIAWSTRSDPDESIVNFGYDCNDTYMIASGERKLLDSNGVHQYIHFTTLKHLRPQSKYCYSVGSHKSWSKQYEFISFPEDQNWSPTVALVGDMGYDNGRSINSLSVNTLKGKYDAVIHIGDIGYNLYAFNGLMGDSFMNAVQPFAARVPYMVIPGNHEYICYDNRCPSDYGTSYETRFKMPQSDDNSHYTFTLGPILFIGISTEVYFQSEMSDLEASQKQLKWLTNVLKEANKPENRARHPWIVLYGHRPLYCSAESECIDGMTPFIKDGNVVGSLFDIDDLLYAYGVDLAFWGHMHYYERMYPTYNQTAYVNSMYSNAFVNPRATVHIISGTGGMHSGTETYSPIPALWTAFRSSAYGYTRFTVYNESHLYLEQIDVDKNDLVIDSNWIVQQEHQSFIIKNKNLKTN